MKIFRKLSKLTAWLIFSKKHRLLYKEFMASIDLKDEIKAVHDNYKKVILKINEKSKTDKIKVVFLVRENQKWTYQSLYDRFAQSDKFEPLVLVSILTIAARGKDKTRNNLDENYIFFKSRGMNVDFAYKNGEYVDLKEFDPDIVFYDQPWDLPEIHQPFYVSNFALTCYSSYGYEILEYVGDYTQSFHRFLYKFFVEDGLNIERYGSYNKDNVKNCVAVGYPKLDEYFNAGKECNLWNSQDKFKVIYAPHHSLDSNGLKLSTFHKNGKFILELAKRYPQTTWIFKPHPRLKYAILRTKTMSEDELNNYFDEWSKIGNVYEDGNYIDILRTSDLMITEGCSFLAEYLPTGKPLIRLVNKNSVKLNALGNKISKVLYEAETNSEIENIFKTLLNNNDFKKEERKKLISKILNGNKKSSELIYDIISKDVEVV